MSETSPKGGTRDRKLAVTRELARRELARRRYGDYLAYVNGPGWVRTRFSEYLAGEIQRFVETDTGNAYDILLIEAPPQHGKSMAVTEAAPAFFLGRHPRWRVIIASYNDESAERFARRNREKVRDFGPILFGTGLGEIRRTTEFELAASGDIGVSGTYQVQVTIREEDPPEEEVPEPDGSDETDTGEEA